MSSPCSEEEPDTVKCEIVKIEGGGKIKTGKQVLQSEPVIHSPLLFTEQGHSPVTFPYYPLSYIHPNNSDCYSYYQTLAAAAASHGIYFHNL